MGQPQFYVQAQRVRRGTITIPASGGTAANLEALIVAELNTQLSGLGNAEAPRIVGAMLFGAPLSYTVGDRVGHTPVTIPAGTTYSEPGCDFAAGTWIRSTGAATSVAYSVALTGDVPSGYEGR